MTQPSAVFSIVRLAKPEFRNNDDKLAFAVHAYVLSKGYKLVATGASAEDADFSSEDKEEVDAVGWDSLPGFYAFRYQDAEQKQPPLYLKCLSVGPKLLVQWIVGADGDKAGSAHVTELDTSKFTTDTSSAPAAYQNADELMKLLDSGLGAALEGGGVYNEKAAQPSSRDGTRAMPGQEQQEQPGPSNRPYNPLQEGPVRYPHPIPGCVPLTGVGYEDVVPPGVIRPPGMGGGAGGVPELIGGGPPHRGGGMHVGPGHPMFGPGKLGGGVGMPGDHGTGLPPGARWDPIGPPGTRGFRPDDFKNDPSKPHPDMMQPGPGKGTDWDAFYG